MKGVLIAVLLCLSTFAQSTFSPVQPIDFSKVTTKPFKEATADPATCTVGEFYNNITTMHLRRCTAPNVWSDAGVHYDIHGTLSAPNLPLNVLAFGAKGDNNPASASGNVIAFQTAFDTVESNGGGSIYVPKGKYYLNSKVLTNRLGYKHWRLYGDGDRDSILIGVNNGTEYEMLNLGVTEGIPDEPREFTIDHIQFTSDDAGPTSSTLVDAIKSDANARAFITKTQFRGVNRAIWLNGYSDQNHISDTLFTGGCRGVCIELNQPDATMLTKLNFEWSTARFPSSQGGAITIHRGYGVSIIGCHFNIPLSDGVYAINQLDMSSGTIMEGNHFEIDRAIKLQSGVGVSLRNNYIAYPAYDSYFAGKLATEKLILLDFSASTSGVIYSPAMGLDISNNAFQIVTPSTDPLTGYADIYLNSIPYSMSAENLQALTENLQLGNNTYWWRKIDIGQQPITRSPVFAAYNPEVLPYLNAALYPAALWSGLSGPTTDTTINVGPYKTVFSGTGSFSFPANVGFGTTSPSARIHMTAGNAIVSTTASSSTYGFDSLSSGSLASNKVFRVGINGKTNGFTLAQDASQNVIMTLDTGDVNGQILIPNGLIQVRLIQSTATNLDPGCTTTSHLGRLWFDNTTATTVLKVCMNVSGTVQWVTK